MASTTISIFFIFSIFPLLSFVGAINGSIFEPSSIQCPPPPPCICNPTPPLLPPPTPSPNAQPLPPPPTTLQPLPTAQPPPSPPPQTTPPHPPQTTPPPPPQATLSPPPGGICFKNDTESQICANILSIADGNLSTGRAEPCCSIVRGLSDVAALTCLCKSVGARPLSLSPNINIFFRTCTGRRIPQGFSCPGLSPTIPPPPPPTPPQITPSPPPPSPPLPPPETTPPPHPQATPSPPPGGICFKNDTESQICANILSIADGNLSAGRAEPCCSIVRGLSDVAALTCLCKSVGAKPLSLSPNINIFFRTCTGRRIPQGFSCPGLSPTIPPPPPPTPTQTTPSPPPPSPPPHITASPPPPLPPPQTTPPPPPTITPPLSPPPGGICFKNNTESQICANILSISDGNLNTRMAEPCCSIIRSLSDVAALTCLCKSVGARPLSFSPNINIFFRTCTGRRIPQGFSCP